MNNRKQKHKYKRIIRTGQSWNSARMMQIDPYEKPCKKQSRRSKYFQQRSADYCTYQSSPVAYSIRGIQLIKNGWILKIGSAYWHHQKKTCYTKKKIIYAQLDKTHFTDCSGLWVGIILDDILHYFCHGRQNIGFDWLPQIRQLANKSGIYCK